MLPTKFRFSCPSGFRGKYFFTNQPIGDKKGLWRSFVNGSGQNEHYLQRTFHRCFLPSFSWFGWEVSEEKIKMWKVNGLKTTDAKWWQKPDFRESHKIPTNLLSFCEFKGDNCRLTSIRQTRVETLEFYFLNLPELTRYQHCI